MLEALLVDGSAQYSVIRDIIALAVLLRGEIQWAITKNNMDRISKREAQPDMRIRGVYRCW